MIVDVNRIYKTTSQQNLDYCLNNNLLKPSQFDTLN